MLPPGHSLEAAAVYVKAIEGQARCLVLPDGRYRVRCVVPGIRYTVGALVAGLPWHEGIAFEGRLGLLSLPDLVVPLAGAAVRGRVVGRVSGAPLAATVHLHGPAATARAFTAADGQFELWVSLPGATSSLSRCRAARLSFPFPAGRLRLALVDPPPEGTIAVRWSAHGGFLAHGAAPTKFVRDAPRVDFPFSPSGPCQVELTFEGEGRRVRFRTGPLALEPEREHAIRCWPAGPFGALRGRHPFGQGFARLEGQRLLLDVELDAAGRFAVDDLPAGRYRVAAGRRFAGPMRPLGPGEGVAVEVVAGAVSDAPEVPLLAD